MTLDLALKRVSADVVEGLAFPYGVDTDGEQFTKDTDLALEWFGKSGRPVLYDHGRDEPQMTVIGRQVEYEEREDGRWAQAQLSRNNRYRKAVDRLVDEGALGFSSGAMAHLAKVGKSGRIERWPWVELSLTPIPAHLGALVHYQVKSTSLLEHLGDDETQLSIAAVKAIAAGLDPASPGTDTLDEKAGRVSAALDEFRDHARAAADMRAKSGRVLSSANRERIRKALESEPLLRTAFADLAALLDETDPEEAQKSSTDMRSLLALEAIKAMQVGVEVSMP